jgi:hypothetical protein
MQNLSFNRSALAGDGFIALASSSNDGIAAEALAVDLMAHAKGVENQEHIWGAIQTAMVKWCKPYPPGELPSIQYLMALRTSSIARMYLLQPRNQIVPVPQRRAIGAGARVVDAMLDDVFPEDLPFEANVALFNMAYMARKAKDQESQVGGGSKSNAIYIPDHGRVRWIAQSELWLAEELSATVDERLNATRRVVMSLGTITHVEKTAESFKKWMIAEAASLADKIDFQSLNE